jgi:hypothetical protein
MTRRISDLSRLNLDDVRDRVYTKYDVTRSDSELAVEYLRCFFDAKRAHPNKLIILPQIADWAWHELILDTARYREVCLRVFGRFLHHVAEPVRPQKPRTVPNVGDLSDRNSMRLRETFEKSLEMMNHIYGLGLGDHPDEWREAGWDRPIYRLRNPILAPHYTRNLSNFASNEEAYLEGSKPMQFLSWLPWRIVHRFGMPVDVAWRGVREYFEMLISLRSPRLAKVLDGSSPLCEIAWEEHVLWTQRYARDCYSVLGYFLERHPRANFVASVVM